MFFKEHPYTAVLIGVLLLLIGGAVVVWNKSATNTGGGAYTWGRSGGFSDLRSNLDSQLLQSGPRDGFSEKDLLTFLNEGRDSDYASLIPQSNVYQSNTTGSTVNEAFSYNEDELAELLASISPTAQIIQPNNPFEDTINLSDIFAFVPATVAATTSTSDGRLTLRQRKLFDYGNETGSFIETYADLWGDQALLLRAFVEDRTDQKAAVVSDLAFALTRLGKSLEDMEGMPNDVAGIHKRIATGYQKLGEKLEAVSKTRSDEELLSAITDYNAAADIFAKDFLAMVTLFSVAEVTFSQNEPGKVFVFSPTSSF